MTMRTDGSGRDERFKCLYQKYYWRVVRFYVRAFRFDQADAEELAQDAFMRFYQAMDEYRGDAEWAFFETIARNVAFNRIRSGKTLKRNARIVNIDDPDARKNEPTVDEPDYGEREADAIRRKKLYDEIAKLPPRLQEPLRLWLEGFKYDEVAKALRVTPDTVKSSIRDARRVLRERLGDEASLPEEQQ